MYSGKRNKVHHSRRLKQNEEVLIYLEAVTTIGDMIIKARKKQDSEKLKLMAKCIQDIAFYVNYLETDRDNLVFEFTKEKYDYTTKRGGVAGKRPSKENG